MFAQSIKQCSSCSKTLQLNRLSHVSLRSPSKINLEKNTFSQYLIVRHTFSPEIMSALLQSYINSQVIFRLRKYQTVGISYITIFIHCRTDCIQSVRNQKLDEIILLSFFHFHELFFYFVEKDVLNQQPRPFTIQHAILYIFNICRRRVDVVQWTRCCASRPQSFPTFRVRIPLGRNVLIANSVRRWFAECPWFLPCIYSYLGWRTEAHDWVYISRKIIV